MKSFRQSQILLVLCLALWSSFKDFSGQGALRYVDPENGSDKKGDATKENPVKSVSKAIDFSKSGDTLFLQSGSFSNILLPKSLGIWGNPDSLPTIEGPIRFAENVVTLNDLHYRDFIISGSAGVQFENDMTLKSVSFERLTATISEKGPSFLGGNGLLNISGEGLLFKDLDITHSASDTQNGVKILANGGPITFENVVAVGNGVNTLKFLVDDSPTTVRISNVSFSENAYFEVANPKKFSLEDSDFVDAGLIVLGGSGQITRNTFKDISDEEAPVLVIGKPRKSDMGPISYEISENVFENVHTGLNLGSLAKENSPDITFHLNSVTGDNNTLAIVYQLEGFPVDARENYFGDARGPYDYLCNPETEGTTVHPKEDKVLDNINYRPWCKTEECTEFVTERSSCAAGDDPSTFLEDDADETNPWGLSILIIAVATVAFLIVLVIVFFFLKVKQTAALSGAGHEQMP